VIKDDALMPFEGRCVVVLQTDILRVGRKIRAHKVDLALVKILGFEKFI